MKHLTSSAAFGLYACVRGTRMVWRKVCLLLSSFRVTRTEE